MPASGNSLAKIGLNIEVDGKQSAGRPKQWWLEKKRRNRSTRVLMNFKISLNMVHWLSRNYQKMGEAESIRSSVYSESVRVVYF